MKKFSILIVIVLIFYNCQKDIDDETPPKEQPKTQPTLKVYYNGSYNGLNQGVLLDTIRKTASFQIETNQKDWSFIAEKNDNLPDNEKWLVLKKAGNTLNIEAKNNFTDYDRIEHITISVNNGELRELKTIVQYSYDPPLESFIPDVYFRKKVRTADPFINIESRRTARIFARQIYIDRYGDDIHIRSLTGIESLLNLNTFKCSNSNIKTLKLPNSPKLYAYLNDNIFLEQVDLKSLDSLKGIHISNSSLLNILDCSDLISLTSLSLSHNNIHILDLSNNKQLESLSVQEANLRMIDVTKNTKLVSLRFGGLIDFFNNVLFKSDIDKINISENKLLKSIFFNHTKIRSLDMSNNLEIELIECNHNLLDTINISKNITLKSLNCSNNNIKFLDVSNSPNLLHLDCTNNPIEIVFVNEKFDLNNPLPTYKIPPTAKFRKK